MTVTHNGSSIKHNYCVAVVATRDQWLTAYTLNFQCSVSFASHFSAGLHLQGRYACCYHWLLFFLLPISLQDYIYRAGTHAVTTDSCFFCFPFLCRITFTGQVRMLLPLTPVSFASHFSAGLRLQGRYACCYHWLLAMRETCSTCLVAMPQLSWLKITPGIYPNNS